MKLKPYMLDDRECVLRLTQDIKEAVVRQLVGRYGGGASKPITIIGGWASTSSTRMRRSSGLCLAAALGCFVRWLSPQTAGTCGALAGMTTFIIEQAGSANGRSSRAT